MLLIFVISFCIFTAISFFIINKTKINGSIHKQISSGQDLVAEILPPSGYIIETHLYNSELMTEFRQISSIEYMNQLNKYESDYIQSKKAWKNSPPEIQRKFEQSDRFVKAYFFYAKNSFYQSLTTANRFNTYSTLSELFLQHKKSILEIVKIQKNINDKIETEAQNTIESALIYMSIIALFILLIVSTSYLYLSDKIKLYNKQLGILIKEKDRFYSIVAHDLRGPIWNIQTMLNMIKNEEIPDEDEKKFLIDNLEKQSEKTAILLDDLLEWTRLQSGSIEPEKQKVNITDVIQDGIGILEETAYLKEISITKNINDCELDIDPRMMSTVLRNLVSNSLKFTHSKGNINISTSVNDQILSIKIRDTGVGMSKEKLEKLLNDKGRNSSKGTKGEIGSGLGLKICQELTKRNNGRFSIKSTEGVGTEVTIEFDLKIS